MSLSIQSVLVIGAGVMGRGIAQWFSQQGLITQMVDKDEEFAQKALQSVHTSWKKLLAKKKFSENEVSSFKEGLTVNSLETFDPSVDLVVEAIYENLEAKQNLFQNLCKKLPGSTYLASNTSSIPLAQICFPLESKRKEKFLGIHFFNPAPIMKLVEIIEGPMISEAELNQFCQWFEDKNKKAARCIDSPGFIVNRVARNFYGEAFRLANADNQGRFKEIDQIMKEVGGFRMGPFELVDLIGVDVNYSVTQSVWKEYYQHPRFAPHRLQKKLVDEGRNGKKSGRGFYRYDS